MKTWRPYETKTYFYGNIANRLMLFASFFGAGNLIFPPALGQSAGVNFLPAAAGFCTTGVGIPLLGIIAIGLLRASNPEALALPVHPKFAKALIVVTVLTIGPFLQFRARVRFLLT